MKRKKHQFNITNRGLVIGLLLLLTQATRSHAVISTHKYKLLLLREQNTKYKIHEMHFNYVFPLLVFRLLHNTGYVALFEHLVLTETRTIILVLLAN